MKAISHTPILALCSAFLMVGALQAQGTDLGISQAPRDETDKRQADERFGDAGPQDAERVISQAPRDETDKRQADERFGDVGPQDAERVISQAPRDETDKRQADERLASPGAQLTLRWSDDRLVFHVSGHGSANGTPWGAVILSFQGNLCNYFDTLPPLLCDHKVLATGLADPSFTAAISRRLLPADVAFYAQGILGTGTTIVVSEPVAVGSDQVTDEK